MSNVVSSFYALAKKIALEVSLADSETRISNNLNPAVTVTVWGSQRVALAAEARARLLLHTHKSKVKLLVLVTASVTCRTPGEYRGYPLALA